MQVEYRESQPVERSEWGVILPARDSRLRQALEVLHGTANTLNLHSKAPQHIDGNHPPVGIEGNHVREHAAKGEGFRGFA